MTRSALHHHETDGLPLLAGLEWQPHDGSAGIGLANSLRGGSCVKWRGARAVVHGTALPVGGAGALLAQMCLAAEEQNHDTTGHWAWVAQVQSDDDNPASGHEAGPTHWWLGATDDGTPSQTVTEEIHTRLTDLVNALAGISATCELAGIGVCAPSADALMVATRAHGPELPEPVLCKLDEVSGEPEDAPDGKADQTGYGMAGDMSERGGPRFAPIQRMTPMVGVLSTVIVTAALGGAAWSTGLIGPSVEHPPTIALFAPQKAAGRIACRRELERTWPRAPGWRISGSGCSRPAFLAQDLKLPEAREASALDLVIWRSYHREAGANAVLAEAAAKHLVAGWTTGHVRPAGKDKQLILWRVVQLPSETFDPADPARMPYNMAEMARLMAQTFADEPGAVSRSGAILTVDVSEPPARAFDRLKTEGYTIRHADIGHTSATIPEAEPGLDNAPDIELLSVIWTGTRTTMQLRARTGDVL